MRVSKHIVVQSFIAVFAAALLCGCHAAPIPNSLAAHDSSRWERDIAAFEASEKTNPPPQHCIVFIGSSSIRIWKTLQNNFPGFPVVNRGFGGSQLADSVNYADRIVIPYHPREVVMYAGSNDINAGKTAEIVFGDFVAFATRVHAALPKTVIAYISIAPNPSRWKEVEEVKRANSLIQDYCSHHSNLKFINVFPLMLGPDGKPKPEIFLKDGLHMNERGYAIWKPAIMPFLVP
jgi:lysophospholipase L1-like esterase